MYAVFKAEEVMDGNYAQGFCEGYGEVHVDGGSVVAIVANRPTNCWDLGPPVTVRRDRPNSTVILRGGHRIVLWLTPSQIQNRLWDWPSGSTRSAPVVHETSVQCGTDGSWYWSCSCHETGVRASIFATPWTEDKAEHMADRHVKERSGK